MRLKDQYFMQVRAMKKKVLIGDVGMSINSEADEILK